MAKLQRLTGALIKMQAAHPLKPAYNGLRNLYTFVALITFSGFYYF